LIKKKIKKFLNLVGLNLSKYDLNNSDFRLNYFLKKKSIECIFDIGANVGQYGIYLRKIGYKNKIISFEPILEAYTELDKISKKDKLWKAYNFGLGDENRDMQINVSKNSVSSSLLKMNDNHVKAEPESKYIATQNIKINTFEKFISYKKIVEKKLFLKIDVQGYEHQVIAGIKNFNNIEGLQIEMSLEKLYENQMIFEELYALIKNKGFELWDLRRGFCDNKNGKVLQLDGIFFKNN